MYINYIAANRIKSRVKTNKSRNPQAPKSRDDSFECEKKAKSNPKSDRRQPNPSIASSNHLSTPPQMPSVDATPDSTADHKQPAAISPNPTTTTTVAAAAATMMHASNGNSNDVSLNQRIKEARDCVNRLTDSDLIKLVNGLLNAQTRRDALDVLSKVVNYRPNKTLELAPMLWNSPRITFILLEEVMTAYRYLDNEDSLKLISGRVVNAMCLFQCIAMHSGLRKPFVAAQIPVYLYPFLRKKESNPTIERLRLASLGSLGVLVKMNDPEMIHYLLDSQVFPCCLCSLEFGDQLSKSVAVYVMYKLLASEFGIQYCCNFPERFLSVLQVLRKIAEETSELNEHTVRMLKFVIGCYLALSEFPRACEYIKLYFPSRFCSGHFATLLQKVEPRQFEDLMRLFDKINAEMIRLRLPLLGPLIF